MLNQYNPFKENRAEQMRDLWKYYVPVPGIDCAGKPLVVEGGRGSGKTMFFLCNSWREKIDQLKKESKPISEVFENSFIGIYYRVDTAFVSTMIDKDIDDWSAVFETYLCICLLREYLYFFKTLDTEGGLKDIEIVNFINLFVRRFEENYSVDSIDEFLSLTDKYLDNIEDVINGITTKLSFRYIKVARFINDLSKSFNNIMNSDTLFKVFIDEYETLQEYQQKIVNTLIKHSMPPVVYNIGLRPKGMKTRQTISETETIESPHDYEVFEISLDDNNYNNVLKLICKKRIQYGKAIGKIPPEASEQIEYYLGIYSIEDEVSKIVDSKILPKYLEKLAKDIVESAKQEGKCQNEIDNYVNELCINAHPINSKLHYLLLNKKTLYTPKVSELYCDYMNQTKRYKEWIHNRKFGIVFLLARDYKKDKMYYGFDVFAAISSGIVRYFLELCEQVFKIAFLDNFTWAIPISYQIQSDATKYVSEYKIADISGYEPYGRELRIFIQFLGQIFQQLHISYNITLGEPEPNHFSTDDLSLSQNISELLSSAIMWNVLQEGEPTKKKRSNLSPETVDYYINRIYVPYFGISYRNQRKLNLREVVLQGLLSGDVKLAKAMTQQYLKENDISEHQGGERQQLTLFESCEVLYD